MHNCIHTDGALVPFVTKDYTLKPSDSSLVYIPDLLRYSIFKIEGPLNRCEHTLNEKWMIRDTDLNLIYIFVTLDSQN